MNTRNDIVLRKVPMTKRLATRILTVMLLVAVVRPPVSADDSELARATLKGITVVYVLVEKLPDGAKKLDLTKETIQTDIELKLRLAGMQVVSPAEGYNLPGSTNLYINVNVTASALAAHIDVELDQNATLERTNQVAFGVTTWSKSILLSNPSGQAVRDDIKDLVDVFLKAWLSVNPKK